LLPGQQALPGWPQFAQIEAEHTRLLARHTLVALVDEVAVVVQQVSPGLLPQVAQMPDEHLVPGAVQTVPVVVLLLVPLVQQGLPGPPQAPSLHEPALQVPGRGRHAPPLATHMPERQQPLLLQVLPEQQYCPGPPHVALAPAAPPAAVTPPVPAPPLALTPPPPKMMPPLPPLLVTAASSLPPAPPLPTMPPVPSPPVDVTPPPLPPSPGTVVPPSPPAPPPVPPSLVLDPLHPCARTTAETNRPATTNERERFCMASS
jgi:hypothetical protein